MPSLLPLLLLVHAAALVGAVTIAPSNSSTSAGDDEIQLKVTTEHETMQNISNVVPLTRVAGIGLDSGGVTGQLFLATDETASSVTDKEIAYINCDASAHPGFVQAPDVLRDVVDGGAAAVLFFSPTSSHCNVSLSDDDNYGAVYMYSMVNAAVSQQVLTDVEGTPSSMKYLATILPRDGSGRSNSHGGGGGGDGGDDENTSPSNPLGPSPSTAVAMIILYTITGIITALFLVVIVTGALRAHRHPERYGPGVLVGRGGRGGQRQTRARGIARAMLDTIPIVKFGERAEPEPKPTDVEMGETGAAAVVRNSGDGESRETADPTPTDGAQAVARREPGEAGQDAPVAAATAAVAPATTTAVDGEKDAVTSGAGAGTAAAPAAPALDEDDSQGCTICTDDFERGQDIRVLPCNHKFHPACIDPWLLNVSGTCPLCRIDLHPTATNTSTTSAQNQPSAMILAPPLDADGAAAAGVPRARDHGHNHHHRRSVREFLHLRHHGGDAGERMAVARRMAGEERGRGVEGIVRAEEDDGAGARRRSRRLSGLLLGGGRRRGGSVGVVEEEGVAGTGGAVGGVREETEAAEAAEREEGRERERVHAAGENAITGAGTGAGANEVRDVA